MQLSFSSRALVPAPATQAARRSPLQARHAAPAAAQAAARRQRLPPVAAGGADPAAAAEDGEGGLLPEEDREIPGGYRDAMSSNTELGKAVRDACEELDTLGGLERETLQEAEGLLKKLGFKGSLFQAPAQQQQGGEQQPGSESGSS